MVKKVLSLGISVWTADIQHVAKIIKKEQIMGILSQLFQWWYERIILIKYLMKFQQNLTKRAWFLSFTLLLSFNRFKD